MGYRKFLFTFLSIILFFVAIVTMFLFYLNGIYEHNSYENIVDHQIKNDAIYGSALNENYFKYRLAMVKKIKPEILMIGSSRAGQFRKKFFNTSFLTTANGANTLREMEYFTKEVLKIYHPKVIIFIVDPWDFNPKYPNYQQAKYQGLSGTDIGFEKIFLSLKYIVERKMPIINIFNKHSYFNATTGYSSMGIRSIVAGDGSFPDGSYMASSLIYNADYSTDREFLDTLKRIRNGENLFAWSKQIDSQRVMEFQKMIDQVRRNNIEVISIVVPLAPRVYQEMQKEKEKYAYIEQIKNEVGNLKFLLNPAIIDTNNCEFLDGFHPGDVAIARTLKKIGEEDKAFGKYLDMQEINLTIRNYAGHVYSNESKTGIKEIDFLRLGCTKK